MNIELQEAIERRAYELWQAEGFPEGRALDHWLQAEREFGLPAGASQPLLNVVVDEVPAEGEEQAEPSSLFEALNDPLAHTDRP